MLLDGLAPLAPEVIGDPRCDIHAPTRRAAIEPELHDGVLFTIGESTERGRGFIQFRQVAYVNPAFVLLFRVALRFIEAVPTRIGRIAPDLATFKRAFAVVLGEAVKVE